MAEDIYKKRIFVVNETTKRSSEFSYEWNGRDSDELCGTLRVERITKRIEYSHTELDTKELIKQIESKISKAKQVIADNPNIGLTCDESKVFATIKHGNDIVVLVHCGIKGQYIDGILNGTKITMNFEHCSTTMFDNFTESDEKRFMGAILYVQNILKSEGKLDERYEIEQN